MKSMQNLVKLEEQKNLFDFTCADFAPHCVLLLNYTMKCDYLNKHGNLYTLTPGSSVRDC